MRIGMDFRPAMRATTGIGRYVRELAAALVASGCDVRLYGVFMTGNVPRLRVAPDGAALTAWKIPSRFADFLGRAGVMPADRAIGGCSVFHLTNYITPVVRRSTPQVMTVHDLAWRRGRGEYHTERAAAALDATMDRAVQRCAAFLVPSEATARDCEELLGLSRDRMFLTPLGVDASRFHARAPDEEHPFLLSVGTLEPRKNHVRLIRAFAAAGLDAELRIAGGHGWLCDDVVALAEATPRVRLLGHVAEPVLLDQYARATALVYPSLLEGFGLPVLEGLAAGVPVITSDRAPLRDVAGGAALLVDPESEESLADALRRVVSDRALRTELSERGRARAASFTWARCAEATLRAYEAAIS